MIRAATVWLTVLTLASAPLTALAAKPATEAPAKQKGPPSAAEASARLAKALGLDEGTRAAVEAVLSELLRTTKPLRDEAQRLGAEARAQREAGEKPDPATQARRKELHAQIEAARAAADVKIEAQLTPAQVAAFRELRAKREERRDDKPGGGQEPKPGGGQGEARGGK
jgi:Spy/CpxP family protein refolding chaperone